MLVKELLQRLHSGEPMADISNELGLHRTTLPKKLKDLGYVFDRPTKRYNWEGEGMEPHDINVLENNRTTKVNSIPYKVHKVENHDSLEIHTQSIKGRNIGESSVKQSLTIDEISALREIIQEWRSGGRGGNAPSEGVEPPKSPLYEQVAALPGDSKTRRTIVIGETTVKTFDAFADRHKLLNKSDLIELALLDFMEKYN